MSPAWDRDEALDVAVRMSRSYRKCVGAFPGAEECTPLIRATALLRAADAEITRLRSQEEAAEKMAEALRAVRSLFHYNSRCGHTISAALSAWDASRGGGGR